MYQIAIIIYMFATIWGCINVVASSLTSVIPMTFLPRDEGLKWTCTDPTTYSDVCSDSYWIWVVLGGLVSSIMIFFDLSEQKVLQQIFTGCRFVLFAITAVIIIYCLSTQPFLDKSLYTDGNYINPHTVYWKFDLQSIGALFSSLTFS